MGLRSPVVTIARSLSDTFAGIRLIDVAPFIAAQLGGAAAATILVTWFVPPSPRTTEAVLVLHSADPKEPEYAVS